MWRERESLESLSGNVAEWYTTLEWPDTSQYPSSYIVSFPTDFRFVHVTCFDQRTLVNVGTSLKSYLYIVVHPLGTAVLQAGSKDHIESKDPAYSTCPFWAQPPIDLPAEWNCQRWVSGTSQVITLSIQRILKINWHCFMSQSHQVVCLQPQMKEIVLVYYFSILKKVRVLTDGPSFILYSNYNRYVFKIAVKLPTF